jgi:RNA polymerase sigma factor (sigma-70 family)
METVETLLHTQIVRAGMGDIRAFESIVRRYHKLAFGYAISLLGDYHLAEDAVQESFTEVFRSLRNLRSPAAFPSWLRLIVLKQCDRLTRRKRHREVPYSDHVEGSFESPETHMERQEQEDAIRRLIRTLPQKQRLVTELFYMDGLSQSDIAQFLEIKSSTVRKRLFDSRKRLKKEMAMTNEQQTDSAVRALFSNRLAPELLDKLLKNPSILELNGEERNLTVLFADAVGITDKQSLMELRDFFAYMNDHFAILFDIIVSNQGFLDKIIGDEFMALWGTPANPEDHSTHACYAAIDMQTKLRELRESSSSRPGGDFRISIGVNTGNAMIGNFGPPNLLQYTPLGDTINFGSRLERVARTYGVEIAIGEETYKNARKNIIARKLDDIEARNQVKKVGIYELIERKSTGVTDTVRRKIAAFSEGYDAFETEDYTTARKGFLAALDISDGADVPSLIYLQRCAEKQ